MPDPAAAARRIAGDARALILEMVRGDLALRELSLSRMRAGSVLPSILFASRMTGELEFKAELTGKRGLRLVHGGHGSATRIADIRLGLAVAPAMDPVHRPEAGVVTRLALPVFVQDDHRPGRLILDLHDGRVLEADLDGADLRSWAVRGGGGEPRVVASAPVPVASLVSLLETLAAWERAPRRKAPVPLTVPATGRLSALLEAVTGGYGHIAGALDPASWGADLLAADRRLREGHPDLGLDYGLEALDATLTLWLDANDELVDRRDTPDAQQLELRACLDPASRRRALDLSFRYPDILVGGELHGRFLDLLRHRGGLWGARADAMADPVALDETPVRPLADDGLAGREAFDGFVNDPVVRRNAVIARITPDDVDLVLLQGDLAGRPAAFLFSAQFRVRFGPDPAPGHVAGVRLLGARLGAGGWRDCISASHPAHAYFRGVLRRLHTWRTGLRILPETV